jgi:hypothetical protein
MMLQRRISYSFNTIALLVGLLVLALVISVLAIRTLFPPANGFVDLPFPAGVKGSILDMQIRVVRTESYTFALELYFREKDAEDRDRVKKLAGTGQYDTSRPDPRQINTGLPIPVRLSVTPVDAEARWSGLDRVFVNHDLEGFTASFYEKIIVRAGLDPGTYRIRIEALQNLAELNDVPVHFEIHVSPRK